MLGGSETAVFTAARVRGGVSGFKVGYFAGYCEGFAWLRYGMMWIRPHNTLRRDARLESRGRL